VTGVEPATLAGRSLRLRGLNIDVAVPELQQNRTSCQKHRRSEIGKRTRKHPGPPPIQLREQSQLV